MKDDKKKKDDKTHNNEIEVNPEMKEALTPAQRRKRAMVMKRNKGKIAAARRRNAKRPADREKLKKRSQKAARNIVKKKMVGDQSLSDLSDAQKRSLETRVKKKSGLIQKLSKKLLPSVKKKDREKLRSTKNEAFQMVEE